jgi:hypothetical protein
MLMIVPAYKKISGNGFWLRILPGMRYDLYLGDDHLLLVEQLIFVERYKRFYFGDIQYLAVSPSSRWIVFAIALGLLTFLSALFLLGWNNPALLGIGLLFSALFGSAFVYNLILGPTCIVQVKTAIQLKRLPPLERFRAFRKEIGEIQRRVLEAQQITGPPA